MWLLNAKTLKLKQFSDHGIPPYAILSHTWADPEEVTYQEMDAGHGAGAMKSGSKKIIGCCHAAILDGYEWVWIDTCCIDKTSSAELSEAINSMFRWYQKAGVCYVILSDVSSDRSRQDAEFRGSRWFTRGWTLQELIAPKSLIFFSKNWKEIGTRSSLKREVSSITSIDVDLFSTGDIMAYSFAQKMSWAAHRQVTRAEDIAYCLMGLFDIHMPMTYGEGNRAFLRLQEQIVRQSNDQTIFAWEMPRTGPSLDFYVIGGNGHQSTITLNNGLLEVQLPMVTVEAADQKRMFFVMLACKFPNATANCCIEMKLKLDKFEDHVDTQTQFHVGARETFYSRVMYEDLVDPLSKSKSKSYLENKTVSMPELKLVRNPYIESSQQDDRPVLDVFIETTAFSDHRIVLFIQNHIRHVRENVFQMGKSLFMEPLQRIHIMRKGLEKSPGQFRYVSETIGTRA